MCFGAGESVDAFGFVLEGGVHVVQEDFWGNRNIIANISPGEIFAESYACSSGVPLGVDVITQESTKVLFLSVRRALTACSSACEFHNSLIRNLVSHAGCQKPAHDRKAPTYCSAQHKGKDFVLPVGGIRPQRERSV